MRIGGPPGGGLLLREVPPVRDLDNGRTAIHPSSSSDDDDDDDDDDTGDTGDTGDTAPAAPTTTPTTVACARGSRCELGGRVTSRYVHRQTCVKGHTYWRCHTTNGYGAAYHGSRTCVRTGCGQTFTRCSNAHRGNNPCRFNRGWLAYRLVHGLHALHAHNPNPRGAAITAAPRANPR